MLAVALVAGGASIAVTCTSAGWPARYLWCAAFRARGLRWTWKLVRCPHCNSFWSGLAAGRLAGMPWAGCVAQAFLTLFLVFVVQHALLALGHDMTPAEDLEADLGVTKGNAND